MLIAEIVLKEPLTGKKVTGVFLGLSGAMLLIFSGTGRVSDNSSSVLGYLLRLGSQMSLRCILSSSLSRIKRQNFAGQVT